MMVRTLSEDKKELFLRSALKLFASQGVQNTSTAAIARDAGTASGTLFLYFPTKQDLIHALVLDIARRQSQYIHSRLDDSFSAQEAFHTIWLGSIAWFCDNLEAYYYIRQVRDSGWIDERVALESARYLDYYDAAIQKGLAEGCIKPYPPDLIGGMLYQDIVAVMNLLLMRSERTRWNEIIEQGFAIFWDGIKHVPS